MADIMDTSSFGELFNVPAANAAESPRDTHERAPSEDSIPDLKPTVQSPCPAYENTPVEPDPYLMLSYEVRQGWRLSAELHAVLAHIKLLADIILRQALHPDAALTCRGDVRRLPCDRLLSRYLEFAYFWRI